MSKEHNRWLHWKIKHGLATRGRVGTSPMHPKGIISGLLYKFHYRARDPNRDAGPQVFKQPVGGSVGSAGDPFPGVKK